MAAIIKASTSLHRAAAHKLYLLNQIKIKPITHTYPPYKLLLTKGAKAAVSAYPMEWAETCEICLTQGLDRIVKLVGEISYEADVVICPKCANKIGRLAAKKL